MKSQGMWLQNRMQKLGSMRIGRENSRLRNWPEWRRQSLEQRMSQPWRQECILVQTEVGVDVPGTAAGVMQRGGL
jgi:hypothetical protein